MSRRFNLLPVRHAHRIAERRWAGMVGAALAVLLGLLTLAGLTQDRQLHEAEKERDVEQARTAELVARRGQLVRYRQLIDGIVARERLLAAAMGTEVSWATVLAGLATSFPEDASLVSINAESKLPPFGAAAPGGGDQRSVIGSAALKGYSVQAFTPGVERVLQLLAGVRGLSEPRLQLGTTTEIGKEPVTSFEGTTFLDSRSLSSRYRDGLPAADDIAIPALGVTTPTAPATAQGTATTSTTRPR